MKHLGIALTAPSVLVKDSTVRVLATQHSTNRKTGDMVQVAFLTEGTEPHTAVKTGADQAVCGDCPQRNGGCYVVTCQGPLSSYRADQRGRYAALSSAPKGRTVRYGSYGDIASVSRTVLNRLHKALAPKGHTAYTHQWRKRQDLADMSMASVDSLEEYHEAKAAGWRTFRAAPEGSALQPGEIVCPAIKGKVQCTACLLCCGNSRHGPDVMVPLHGATAAQHTAQEDA